MSAVERFGHEPQYPVSNNWPHLVQQLADFAQAWQKEGEPAFLVGHSLGGILSVMAAARHPELARGVLMLDSPLLGGWRATTVGAAKRTQVIGAISAQLSTLGHVSNFFATPTQIALAEKLGLSRNTVQARMSRLEKSGVFLAFERTLSAEALGFPIEAFLQVTVRQAELPAIREALAQVPEVLQAHGLSGQVDLLVRVACRDTQHLFDTDARILSIEGVERTETSLVMGEVIGYRVGQNVIAVHIKSSDGGKTFTHMFTAYRRDNMKPLGKKIVL